MSIPIYNVQSAKEAIGNFLGISTIHIPSESEVEKIREKQFGSNVPTPVVHLAVDEVNTKQQVDDLGAALVAAGTGSLFFNVQQKGVASASGSVDFDLVMSEQHDITTNVCKHPVEKGAPIADHLQPQPGSGRATILVTNYSLRYSSAGKFADQWSSTRNRALEAFHAFEAIRDARVLVTLTLILKTYTNVAITHVGAPKDADSGDAIYFEVEFQEVRTVSLKHQSISMTCKPADMNSAKNRRASNTVSKGRVNPDTVDMDVEAEVQP